ncbi:hypothetical protein Gotur_014200 [Gossypium turneri]
MKLRLQVIVLLIWTTLITKLLLKFLGLESSQQYMPSANQA